MKNKLLIILILLLTLSASFPIDAKDDQQKQENNQAKLTADRVKYKKNENLRIATGNVVLDYQENHVTAAKLKMYTENNVLLFLNNVDLTRPEETITSQKLEFDLEQDQLVAQKNVVLNTTRNDKKLYLTSDYLKLWLETDNMIAKNNIYLEYNEQQIRGGFLEYNAEKEEMLVTEDAEIKEDDQWIKSDKIIIDLESEDIDATGSVKMEFEVQE